jgi:hypothetical protein
MAPSGIGTREVILCGWGSQANASMAKVSAPSQPPRTSRREDSTGTPVLLCDGRSWPSPGFPTGSEVCLASTPAGFDSLELHAFS